MRQRTGGQTIRGALVAAHVEVCGATLADHVAGPSMTLTVRRIEAQRLHLELGHTVSQCSHATSVERVSVARFSIGARRLAQ